MKIADKWSEVNLKQYQEICDISVIDMDELDKQVKILSVLSNTPEDVICSMPLPDMKAAIRVCQFIYKKHEGGHIKQFIKIGKHKFNVNTDVRKISGGEYIDLTSMVKDKAEINKNLSKIIAIFFHPVNFFGLQKKGCYQDGNQTLESRNKTTKIIEEGLMMDEVFVLSGFFLKSWDALTKATLAFSELQMKKIQKQMKKEMKGLSKIIGDGF